jgi:hypothetical protein
VEQLWAPRGIEALMFYLGAFVGLGTPPSWSVWDMGGYG